VSSLDRCRSQAFSAIAAVGAATDTERWFQIQLTQDVNKGQTGAMPCHVQVCLGSVSLSPYKVARRRPHPEQETAPDAPRRQFMVGSPEIPAGARLVLPLSHIRIRAGPDHPCVCHLYVGRGLLGLRPGVGGQGTGVRPHTSPFLGLGLVENEARREGCSSSVVLESTDGRVWEEPIPGP